MDLSIDSHLDALSTADNLDVLNEISKQVVGADGILTNFSKGIKNLEPSQKSVAGQKLSEVKKIWESAYNQKYEKISANERLKKLVSQKVDFSLPVDIEPIGGRHPISTIQNQIANFFLNEGWQIASGPELESQWFNFDALNFGKDHPARQMQDTFYLEDDSFVLRTHTSPVQARSLIDNGVPLYIACPGRVFRTDELDATHTPVFHQCEGLAVDKGLTMAHLKGIIDAFAKAMFGSNAKTRLRPSYFPFTEPSAEMDVWFEGKKGGAGWIEWGGCGMVNPAVLRSCGIDPEVYSGFAFGMGIERTLMLRHDIKDMHDIVEGDIRFTSQFGLHANLV